MEIPWKIHGFYAGIVSTKVFLEFDNRLIRCAPSYTVFALCLLWWLNVKRALGKLWVLIVWMVMFMSVTMKCVRSKPADSSHCK